MKKKLIAMLIVSCVLSSGCGNESMESSNGLKQNETENDSSELENDDLDESEEWTYEKIEKDFGGIIELDCLSVRDCLNELSWKDYYISGYVVRTNGESSGILEISEDEEAKTPYQITVSQGENDKYVAKVGEIVYIKAQNINSFDDGYYLSSDTINLDDGYVSPEKIDREYMSVMEFLKLMGEIYDDTYFKTEGIVMQDGEDYEGNPKYYLYPSEDGYKEDKFSRVELKFQSNYSNLNGKHVVVMGNPDKNASYQGLKKCNIVGGDEVEETKGEEQKEDKTENDTNVLFQKEYEVDGENIRISMIEKDEKLGITIFANAKDEEKACLMLTCCVTLLDEIKPDEYSIAITVGEKNVMYFKDGEKTTMSGSNNDGSLALSAPDWLVTEFTMSEDEMNSFTGEITNTLKDFGESTEMNN